MISFRKLFTSLLIILLSASMAFAQNLSVDYNSAKLSSVIADIHSKTGYNFVYNNTLIDVNVPVTAKAEGSLRQVLDKVFKNLPISFEIMDNQISLSPAKPAAKAKNDVTVSGVVSDDSGAPLPGVFISVSGSSAATISDIDGRYSLTTVPGATLTFSCIGLKDVVETAPRVSGKLDVTMVSDVNFLDEVVVVGYGVQKKVNLTGSVSSINFSEGLESRPITTTSSALGGLAPGLAVTQTSGRPGEDSATLRVRGNTTLNTNSPLVLVDGVEYSMDQINPQDIESISVLKDASSTAIYGSRAANGVILVTTKNGKAGQTHVSYTGNCTLQLPHLGGMAYVTDYAESMRLVNEGADNVGVSHAYSDQTIALWENAKLHPDELNAYGVKNSIAYPNTDWFSELFRTGFMQNHNVSISGGNDVTRSYVSVGYMDNPGVMSHHGLDSGTRKLDLRANVEMTINKWLTGGIRFSGERQEWGLADISSGFSYLKMAIPGMYPGTTNKWGYIATDEENANANNIFRNMASKEGSDFSYRASVSPFLRAQLYKGLFLEFNANHNVNFNYYNQRDASTNRWNYVTDTLQETSSLENANSKVFNTNTYRSNMDLILRYNNTIGKHDFGALAGYSISKYFYLKEGSYRKGKSDWSITEHEAYTTALSSESKTDEWGLMSFFGRINYAYASKYLFEANLRYDGSSRFAPESRWGLFPSFSAGWRISEESWMSGTKSWLSNLKLRASWGVTGNNNSGNYDWQSTFNPVNVISGGTETLGLLVTSLGNNQLVWETTRTGDIGVDFGFLDNRISGEIDTYVKNTSGILFRPAIYMTMGAVTAPRENLAGVQNRGVELALKWRDGVGKDFSYSVGLNLAYNITEVTSYKGTLVQEWQTETVDGAEQKSYVNNIGDVAQSGFGGYIVEGHVLGDQYIYQLYRGSGAGYSGSGDVDINAGPVNGMIRTEADMQWIQAMVAAGYKFQGSTNISKNTLYYGDFIYADLNGDGNYGDNNDQYFTGHSYTPKVTAGLTLSCKWKGFDAYALLTGAFGFYLNWNTSVYNTTLVNRAQAITRRIADDHYFYDPENPSASNLTATYPRLAYNKTLNDSMSDFYHYKADYVKLKSIQLGYNFHRKWMENANISNLRVFVSGENLFTITSYPGLDPEIGAGISYPLMRSFCGGIQITL